MILSFRLNDTNSSLNAARIDLSNMSNRANRFGMADFSDIHRRDVCEEAFGTGWAVSYCTPGSTLCCVHETQSIPQCNQFLGIGWCCTQDGGCYADLQSACGQPGAVECSDLSTNTTRACCPQDTTCADGYEAREDWARCNIEKSALQRKAASTSSIAGLATASSAVSDAAYSSGPSTSSSIAPSASSSKGRSESSATPKAPASASASDSASSSHPSQSSTLSGGAIAGMAIGSTIAILLVVVCWFLWKRQKANRSNLASAPPPPPSSTHFGEYYSPATEQAEKRGPMELAEGRETQEMDGIPTKRENGARFWQSNKSEQRIELE